MSKREWIEDLIDNHVTRRTFARAALATGAWAAVASVFEPAAEAQSLSDEDVLNFALLVEYVDTEYFTMATYGRRLKEVGIPVTGRGRQGATVGGGAVSLSGPVRVLAEHLTLDEQGHVSRPGGPRITREAARRRRRVERQFPGRERRAAWCHRQRRFEHVDGPDFRCQNR